MTFEKGYEFFERSNHALIDLHKMNEGALEVATMVAYLKQGERDEKSLREATKKADDILSQIESKVERCADSLAIARTPDEASLLKQMGKKIIMMGIENGYAIGRDIANIERYRRRGVVYMTLCHNG
ncbi:membrane dipeptidase, partial [Vibrio sp. FNV 38]|nr:membrane dipeptidase [Vibrio sp. FNV 38]